MLRRIRCCECANHCEFHAAYSSSTSGRCSSTIMATVDGRPAQYGLTLKQLRELMELRGREACEQLRQLGGVQDICKKLYTSPTEGSSSMLVSLPPF